MLLQSEGVTCRILDIPGFLPLFYIKDWIWDRSSQQHCPISLMVVWRELWLETGTRAIYYEICHPSLPTDKISKSNISFFFLSSSLFDGSCISCSNPLMPWGLWRRTTNLRGGEAAMGILLLCEPLDCAPWQSQVLRGGAWLGCEPSQDHIGVHLYFSRGSLGLVQIRLRFPGFLRSFPMDRVVLG